VHISVVCPHCQTLYQLEPSLRGMRMRCPNPQCREIFEVCEETEITPAVPPEPLPLPAGPGRHVAGTVGDLVPILPAEPAAPESVALVAPTVQAGAPAAEGTQPRESAKPAWQAPPPVRKQPAGLTTGAAPARPKRPTPPAQIAELDWGPLSEFFGTEGAALPMPAVADAQAARPGANGPVELAPGTWEAPPVRLLQAAPAQRPAAEPRPAAASPVPAASRRHRSLVVIGLMAALVLGGAGAAWLLYQRHLAEQETQRLERAQQRYHDRNFGDAATLFRSLDRDYPESPRRGLYRVAAELSSLREPVFKLQADPEETSQALRRLREFVAGYQGDPFLKQFQGDLWETFYKLSLELTDWAGQKYDRHLQELARAALQDAQKWTAAADVPVKDRLVKAGERLAEADQKIAAWERKERVLARLRAILENVTGPGVREARELAEAEGLSADREVAGLLAALPAKHRASIVYVPVRPGEARPATRVEDDPSLLVTPALKRRVGETGSGSGVVVALVRGVLYGLDPARGEVRWAKRVSIDSPALPVRVPRTSLTPELVLALTPDSYTLTALDAERGTPVWRYRLKAACASNPVIVANRALVPTEQGYVEEIETTEGTPLGYYQVGQPLPVGGVRQPGTSLVCFPADSYCVYLLDVAKHTCVDILYTGHPAGSLLGGPILLAEPGPGQATERATRPTLVLSQEDGLDALKLRAFPLPAGGPAAGGPPRELRLPGWAWFPPYCDGERLAQVTDGGRFFLYGIEPRAADAVSFFPLAKEDVALAGGARPQGRAQIVHADAERFWALADGHLHKLLLAFDRRIGPKLLHRQLGPKLGSALHAGQVRTGPGDTTLLVLVTQASDGQTCLASAVDAGSGALSWQRQLGLVVRGPVVRLGSRQVLVQDQAGSQYRFRAQELRDRVGDWHLAGQKQTAPPPDGAGPGYLLPAPDGASAYAVASTGATSPTLVVRQFRADGTAPTSKDFPLPAPLAGRPALATDALVMMVANGVLVRQGLAGGPLDSGPNWRAAHAESDAEGYVVSLGGDEYLVTDGSRGLKRLHWPAGTMAEIKASVELAHRVVAAPAALPPDGASGEVRVAVADAANLVTLLQGDALRAVRQWPMSGTITAGPFVRGRAVGCVVDHRRLVWLNPDQDEPPWEYTFDADVVGAPELAGDDLLVVADLSGRFTGFDPVTGRGRGLGYTLKANAAPAAAPVAFGPGRLFAPLTDGTILLLARTHFRHPLLGIPSVW
jgi:hypothetical protein